MQLTGLELTASLRLQKPDDALDIKLELAAVGKAVIQSDFYKLLFFDFMNGNVTGITGTVTTGLKAKVYDVADVKQIETLPAQFDWYEDETNYICECTMTKTQTVATTFYAESVKINYVADEEGIASDLYIFNSTAPATSSFATVVGPDKGIEVLNTDGDVTATVVFKFTIKK